MKIAVDAMGGDYAPAAVVEGVAKAIPGLDANVVVVLIGDEQVVRPMIQKYDIPDGVVEIVHASQVIEMGEHPTKALAHKPDSSISVGFKLLKDEAVDIFCSAGNTGAMTVGSLFSIKAISGLLRPAIAGIVPQIDGSQSIMLDIGANADCKPETLAQFGEIGSIYYQYTYNVERPRVALMNIGEEEQKGSLLTQAAYVLLRENKRINFIGNIEGKDFFTNKADVIVTDGFTGNILYKLGESLYPISKVRGFKDSFIDQTNYEAIGGSPVLGVNGNVMIAHGMSSPLAICNMINLAVRQVKAGAYRHIVKALA